MQLIKYFPTTVHRNKSFVFKIIPILFLTFIFCIRAHNCINEGIISLYTSVRQVSVNNLKLDSSFSTL